MLDLGVLRRRKWSARALRSLEEDGAGCGTVKSHSAPLVMSLAMTCRWGMRRVESVRWIHDWGDVGENELRQALKLALTFNAPLA